MGWDIQIDCKHPEGDFIDGIWVCSHCFRMLLQRPKTYEMKKVGVRQRQEILWQAKPPVIVNGIPFVRFLLHMCYHLRFRSKNKLSIDKCLPQCLEALRELGGRYGDPNFGWTRADAEELVDEAICSYWELSGASGSNS